jgi:23S rRNA (cytidine1920-2'-O)/16S rRNA (cytidine1409-2'-O)-methyltransferase
MLNNKFDFFYKIDLPPKGLTFSPIKGAKGNIEYLIFLKREPPYINKSIIEEVVNESWNIFQKKT